MGKNMSRFDVESKQKAYEFGETIGLQKDQFSFSKDMTEKQIALYKKGWDEEIERKDYTIIRAH